MASSVLPESASTTLETGSGGMVRLPAWEDLLIPRQPSSDSCSINDLENMSVATMSVATMSAGVASVAAVGAAGALCQVCPESRMITETGADCVCVLGGNGGNDLIVSGGRGPRFRGSNRKSPWLGLYSTSNSNSSSDISLVALPNCRDIPTYLDAYDNTTFAVRWASRDVSFGRFDPSGALEWQDALSADASKELESSSIPPPIACIPERNVVAICEDGGLQLWDVRTSNCSMTLNAWTGKVNVADMDSENNNRFKVLGSIAGRSGDRKAKTKHVFADDGGNFVGAVTGSSIVIWSLHAAAPLLRIRCQTSPYEACISESGVHFVDGTPYIRNISLSGAVGFAHKTTLRGATSLVCVKKTQLREGVFAEHDPLLLIGGCGFQCCLLPRDGGLIRTIDLAQLHK